MAISKPQRTRNKVAIFDDRQVRRYLKTLRKDSQRKTIYAKASAKAAIPIRRSARTYLKPSLKHSSGAGRDGQSRKPLAKFQDRVNKLNAGRKGAKIPPRKKKTINLVRVKRGKRKYRGGAWITGGPLANILHNSKGSGVKKRAKNGKMIPIVLRTGEVIFTPWRRGVKQNKFLIKAFTSQKGGTIRIFKQEVGKAVILHAKKNRTLGGRAGSKLRLR